MEDDADNIDNFVAETPHDKMFTDTVNCNELNNEPAAVAPFELNLNEPEAVAPSELNCNEQDENLNPDHEKSHEPRSREKIREILNSINEQELRNHLKNGFINSRASSTTN